MYAQRNAPHAPRSNGRGYGYRPAPIRARVGLAMRPSMNFGPMPEAEDVLRSAGLSLSPMSVGAAGLNVGGVSVLATATADDIDSGAVKGLVVPGGAPDAEGAEALDAITLAQVIDRARAKGAPVLAFGEGVAATLRAMNEPAGPYADAPAILVEGGMIQPLADLDAVKAAAAKVG